MFTGIIEEVGRISSIKNEANGLRISCSASRVIENTEVGDSIAVDGVCQTVESVSDSEFVFFASSVTREITTIGSFYSGRSVNLERALTLSDRLGGHIVQGHVDCTGIVRHMEHVKNGVECAVDVQDKGYRFVAEKGSITVNGVSLTVVKRYDSFFTLYLIPESIKKTTLSTLVQGDVVNLEFDVLAKYVEQLMRGRESDKDIRDLLNESGFV